MAALTSGNRVPSSRFRLRQYIPWLAQAGVVVREHIPLQPLVKITGGRIPLGRYLAPITLGVHLLDRIPGFVASYRADLVWIERQLIPGIPGIERACRSPRILDVDDAVWLAPPFGRAAAASAARLSQAVIVGNSYLADYYARLNSNIFVVPTAIDTDRFQPVDRTARRDFIVGWTGTSSNFRYLDSIGAALRRFLIGRTGARFVILSDRRPRFSWLKGLPVDFVSWSPLVEATMLEHFDVGIMPLIDEESARGKCSFKMLQYMASGLPVVVSPVGMNSDVLALGECGAAASTESQWHDALRSLYFDPDRRAAYGRAGRAIAEQRFSTPVVADQLARILRSQFSPCAA